MPSTANGCVKVVDNGADNRRFLLVVTGDGFTATENSAFETAATTLLSGLQNINPIGWRLGDAINVYRLATKSPESGISGELEEGGKTVSTKKTAFGTTLCGDGQSKHSMTIDAGRVTAALTAAGLSWHLVVVIANSQTAGAGIVGNICTVTLDNGNVAATARALGRIAAGLGMEYDTIQQTYPDGDPDCPNLTRNNKGSKWSDDITPDFTLPSDVTASGWKPWMVGAIEGGGNYAKGIYRPSQTCLMRDDHAGFCFVCFKALQKALAPYHQTTALSWLASQDRQGRWASVQAVSAPAQPTPVTALSTATLAGRLFVFTLANGGIGRNSTDLTGNWKYVQPRSMDTASLGVVADIAAGTFNAEVILLALANDTVWLATLPAGGAWGAFAAVPSTGLPPGTLRIACAVVASEVFVFAAGPAGLWMTVRTPAMTWSAAWTEVTSHLAATTGTMVTCVAAASAVQGSIVHVFASAGDGITHGRVSSGRIWQPAESVSAQCRGLSPALDLNCAVRDDSNIFLTAATAAGSVGALHDSLGWPTSAAPIPALPQTVHRVSAGILSGVLLVAAS